MVRVTLRLLSTLTLGAMIAASLPTPALAGTTGTITGRVLDSQSQAPLAGVTVTAVAPSTSVSSVTDANGSFRFLSLEPDTYTLQFTKDGYDQVAQAGISVFADQQQNLSIIMAKTLHTIAKVTSTSAGSLVRAGTTSDVYSVNSTMANAAVGLTGPGSLSNAYGAIQSVPGVSIDPGEQGWYQSVHIRGGDLDQVGYELDGIPVNRVYDNAPMTMLSSLGQQELQVYTGGTPAGSDGQGISGYINQVVRTGTYPGFGTGTLGVGTPAFYHDASIEAGGASPDRLFSYYVGLGGANQAYRYVDNSNGASSTNWFFMPVNLVDSCSFSPGPTGYVYVGGVGNCASASTPLFGAGNLYGIANTEQRDTLMNFHFAIPHKSGGLRDDIQLLYTTSEVFASYYSSQNDLGLPLANALGQTSWDDSYIYTGALGAAPDPTKVVPYYFPNTSGHQFQSALPAALRDTNDNGVAVTKLQYQHAFSSSAFIRAYGYMLYSNWFINGPNTAAQPYYGAELAEYQIADHTYGGNISFTDQIGDKHLLTATASYTGSNLQRYDIGYIRPHYNIASYIGSDGNCYDPTTGNQVGCVWQERNDVGDIQTVMAGGLPTNAGCTTPACTAGAWTITNNSFYTGSGAALNQVHPRFSGISIGDQWRPSDAWNVNIGLRMENYRFIYGPTSANDPTRQFWFSQYNNEYCTGGIGTAPVSRANSATGVLGPCPAGTTLLAGTPFALTNPGNVPDYVTARFQPRLSFTYTVNPNTVIRASAGVYARPPDSSWVEYNVVQQDLPLYLGNHFAAFGYTTPEHNIRPDTSYNYDLSLEQHLKGTDISYKLTPFYRATRDQLQSFFIDPAGGLVSGTNVGNQVSEGVEFALTKGDFNHNGFAGQLSYTYTNSYIHYQNFPGLGVNVIDQLNNYISGYNAFTKAGGGSPCYQDSAGLSPGSPAACIAGTNVVGNPYYNATPQPLMDKNAAYTTYDIIPGPFAGLNGYAVPHTATLLLNYKHDKYAITPTLTFSSGAEYGAPTSWPGYDPTSCAAPTAAWTAANGLAADPANCSGNIFIPNPYNGGHFDTLGQYKQPWTLQVGLGMSYDFSSRVKGTLSFSNLVNVCHQRGYAWDNPHICVYGAMGAGLMAGAGNFYPNSNLAAPPPQLLYPYGVFLNNDNTGFVGATQPLQVTGSLQIKL